MALYDYFDRIAIIDLPDRKDRYESLARELRAIGADMRQQTLKFRSRQCLRMPTGFRLVARTATSSSFFWLAQSSQRREARGTAIGSSVPKTRVAVEPSVLVTRSL
jgi:hypothetical protein